MLKINKKEPEFFKEIKKRVKNPNNSNAWEDDKIKEIKPKLREYITKEQYNLCVYCERLLRDDNMGIDHFKKRSFFPNLTLDYNNLLLSCKSQNSCESIKDSNIKKEDYERFINPVLENPMDFFEYNLSGEILPKNNLNPIDQEKAELTIKILRLDFEGLKQERRKVILQLLLLKDLINSLDDIYTYGLLNFRTMTNWWYKFILQDMK